MDREAYLGIFGLRDMSLAASMPEENACGLWQAWLLPDGDYMINPVDHDHTPVGSSYLIDKIEFISFLTPVSIAVYEEEALPREPALDADAPDLLDFWYKQPLGARPSSRQKKAEEASGPAPDKDFPAEPPESPVEALSFEHSNGNALTLKPFAHAASSSSRGPLLNDTQAQKLEKSMREEFNALLGSVEDKAQPALEQKIVRLLSKGEGFTRKQKFLFSDFGIALRRKRKHYLALAAHKRALSLAPDDENILFNVARAEYELGNIEHAKAYLAKALEKTPDFASARTFLQFLNGTVSSGESHL